MNDSARTYARLVAGVFLLVGVLGFIPGITTNFSEMTIAGHDGNTALLGIFAVNVLHNIVHLAFGAAGLAAASAGAATARTFLIGGGAVYLVVWLYGLVIDFSSAANFINLNTADNWLHLALGVGMIGLGLAAGKATAGDRRTTAAA